MNFLNRGPGPDGAWNSISQMLSEANFSQKPLIGKLFGLFRADDAAFVETRVSAETPNFENNPSVDF